MPHENIAPSSHASHASRWLLLTVLILCQSAAAKAPEWLFGDWVLNADATKAEQPEGKRKSRFPGFGTPTVTINSLPIPIPGTGTATETSTASTVNPGVLRCSELLAEPVGEEVLLTYVDFGSDQLKSGNDQGRRTRWSKTRLTSSYATSTRKVSQTYQLRQDGSLLVTVKLDPNQGPAVVEKRVFERPGAASSAQLTATATGTFDG